MSDGHKFHGWAEHPDFCTACRAQRDEEAADRERERDAEIDRLTCDFQRLAHEALAAVNDLQGTVDRMTSNQVYDIEMAEGTAGADVLADLETVARTLRHVKRIANWRREVELKVER